MLLTSDSFKATKELYIETTALYRSTSFSYIAMYLECSHSKLNHDIETLMMALIAITRNGIIIYIYTFCNTTQLLLLGKACR